KHREHVVPLSERAWQIIQGQLAAQGYDKKNPPVRGLIFPGARDERPMSNTQMLFMLQQLGVKLTVHGFRSTFRDWAGDKTGFPRDLIEFALAHRVGNATEEAYRRKTAVERRRKLMEDWAAYCERPPQTANVIPMERKAVSRISGDSEPAA